MNKGTIVQFRGSWGSGIGFLDIKDSETGEVQSIPCENSPTVRALEACFGNVITEGHTANGRGYIGKEIYWDYDELGMILEGFTPVDESLIW